MNNPDKPKESQPNNGKKKKSTKEDPTTPSEEWGERVETGRRIARGGKEEGEVPGAVGDEEEDPRSGGEQKKD